MNVGNVDSGTPWDAAFRTVDRAAFLPRRAWWRPGGGQLVPIDREADPAAWHSAVSADEPIITQLDDGATAWPNTGGASTSSASQPSAVRAMLEALDVRGGHSVLEIGTGSGYNAALLTARLGAENVTTVELDAELATRARDVLRRNGFRPLVVCDDGARGVPGRSPYDRLISTASVGVSGFPAAWLDQVSTGGVLLAPWGGDYHPGGLVRLTKAADGSASGRGRGRGFVHALARATSAVRARRPVVRSDRRGRGRARRDNTGHNDRSRDQCRGGVRRWAALARRAEVDRAHRSGRTRNPAVRPGFRLRSDCADIGEIHSGRRTSRAADRSAFTVDGGGGGPPLVEPARSPGSHPVRAHRPTRRPPRPGASTARWSRSRTGDFGVPRNRSATVRPTSTKPTSPLCSSRGPARPLATSARRTHRTPHSLPRNGSR